jgi:mono/diheme cytochrome c family protein
MRNVADMFQKHGSRGFRSMRISLGFGVLFSTLLAATGRLVAQEVSNGGSATFATTCAGCHGLEGAGGEHGPTLRGEEFWSQWQGQPLRRLYSRIISTMPQDDPGSLSEQQVLGIVAYLTQLNTGSALNPPVAVAKDLNNITAPVAGAASR